MAWISLSGRFDGGMIELGLCALGSLILAAISAGFALAPSWDKSGPVCPPAPPILWQPEQPSAFTNFFPCAIVVALPEAGFLAAVFCFAALTALVPAERPTAAA